MEQAPGGAAEGGGAVEGLGDSPPVAGLSMLANVSYASFFSRPTVSRPHHSSCMTGSAYAFGSGCSHEGSVSWTEGSPPQAGKPFVEWAAHFHHLSSSTSTVACGEGDARGCEGAHALVGKGKVDSPEASTAAHRGVGDQLPQHRADFGGVRFLVLSVERRRERVGAVLGDEERLG